MDVWTVESGGQCSGCGRVVAAVCVQPLCGVSDEEFAATTATIDGEASGGIIGGVEAVAEFLLSVDA